MMFAVAGNAIVAGTTVVGARYFAMFLVRSLPTNPPNPPNSLIPPQQMPMGAVSAYQIIV